MVYNYIIIRVIIDVILWLLSIGVDYVTTYIVNCYRLETLGTQFNIVACIKMYIEI